MGRKYFQTHFCIQMSFPLLDIENDRIFPVKNKIDFGYEVQPGKLYSLQTGIRGVIEEYKKNLVKKYCLREI